MKEQFFTIKQCPQETCPEEKKSGQRNQIAQDGTTGS